VSNSELMIQLRKRNKNLKEKKLFSSVLVDLKQHLIHAYYLLMRC
jgi:hypothetical protein